MKIRDKLFLGFGLYIFLAAVLGFLAYKELQTITKRLVLVEIADDITNAMLEVRRHEKNFLLFRDDENALALKSYLSILNKNTDEIRAEIIDELGLNNYKKMKETVVDYEVIFDNLVSNIKLQEEGVKRIAAISRKIEKRLKDKDLELFLNVRGYEKTLIAEKSESAYKKFEDSAEGQSIMNDDDVNSYLKHVNRLYITYKEEASNLEEMRNKARDIQLFTENLSKKERQDINNLLENSIRLLFFAILVTIILGIIINMKLSMSIALPIKDLEAVTKRVADGDFSERIKIKGGSELSSLGNSFNQMQEKLQEAMGSLEHAIKKLNEKQAKLVEAEKLASLGKLAAGVAHEINNPLAVINEKAGLMMDILDMSKEMKYKEKFVSIAGSITDNVSRCKHITHRLLGFARRVEVSVKPFDMNEVLNDTIGFLEKEMFYKGVRLEKKLSSALPRVVSDKQQLQQVFLNILKNAVDAVDDGGLIVVATELQDNSRVRVSIKDNGTGVPKEYLKDIFEPFFTTKKKGKGTGLGLSISYGIVKRLGGEIMAESEVNKGTTFIVEIPYRFEGIAEGGTDAPA